MKRKKNSDDQLVLFPPLKHLAEQFELKEQDQDGLKAFREERDDVYTQNARKPRPPIEIGDKVTTAYSASTHQLVFEVMDIFVAHTHCESGYHIKAYSEEYKERTGYGCLELDANWFEKLLC